MASATNTHQVLNDMIDSLVLSLISPKMPGRRVSLGRPPSQSLSGDEGDIDFKLSQGSSDDHSNE
jgi:hypothetical protein